MFDWATFLDLAETLSNEPDESCQRAAVSRAYYAVYCSARNKLRDENKYTPTGRGKDHENVWICFQNGPDKEHKRIYQTGCILKRWRAQVDYNDKVPNLAKYVRRAPIEARKLLSDLQAADLRSLSSPCHHPVSSA